ncbi:hypothetical protein PYR74_12820 [Acinetobacter bereziniae]|uniref:hypothetical protein n=3 Tax=Acinetobacter bereziniae TaxID=106648 RepID=UPI00158108EC|nr:hypothetical protein [Acinetobacter bereziniae]MBJ8452540.1 hypothetical protein [Acinetobacter bereziniae]MBJ8456730.1 hypothetical protein [Acinetobacter bereziniae]MBJ8551822.1 hypothetical protein [Acinetobacter bereziniae]MCM8510538.1 hypothetical protein [Acinetobacter bereziniae]MCV2443959.1 hypothetical protein [Acinetobacter bereziniae]
MFKFQLLSDTDSESGILFAKQKITSNGFNKYITSENYGSDLNGVVIILVCRKPEIILKKRLRLSKKEKMLYMDIMLDYDLFNNMEFEQRVTQICKTLLVELSQVLKKYKFEDFKSDKLIINLENWFLNYGFI